MPNLEPIEESDLDLKNKLLGETEKTSFGEKPLDVVRENILSTEASVERKEGMAEKEASYSKILSKVKTHTASNDDSVVTSDAHETSAEEGAEAKIDKLVKLAMNKGVVHAVKVARHLDDNYALDEFHDRMLADEFHDALVKKGLIKEL